MSIDPVGFLPPLAEIPFDAPESASTQSSTFANWMSKELGSINEKVATSDRLLQRLATGDVDNLHQVMVNLEEAKLSFQLLVQVRNKLLEAYQDILRMQV
jgi:flagellar hook-basal body complex protein FliE